MTDHSLGLEGLATELAQAVQPGLDIEPLRRTMAAALKSMLSRTNPGFKALSGGLTKASTPRRPCTPDQQCVSHYEQYVQHIWLPYFFKACQSAFVTAKM